MNQEVLVSSLPQLDEECFFIAPIGKEGSPERNRSDGVLEFIVARAAQEMGMRAVRGDQLAEPGQITLQVIQHVLGAKAAVADLTGLNPNVYYELAIRHTARLPTVLIAEQGEQLPFDIAQMRTIFFSHTDLRSADQCRIEIVRHLRGAFDGAVDSPIAAAVDLQRLQAGNTVERNVAQLVTSVSTLHKVLANVRSDVRQAIYRLSLSAVVQTVDRLRVAERQLDDLTRQAEQREDTQALERLRKMREVVEELTKRAVARLSEPHGLRTEWTAAAPTSAEIDALTRQLDEVEAAMAEGGAAEEPSTDKDDQA